MIDTGSLLRAAIIGTVLQVAMVVAGHFSPWIALHVFMLGGMAISAVAGLLCVSASYGTAALGGAIAGGACALIGIALSLVLGDTPPVILAFGTLSSAVTGAIGAVARRALQKT